MKSKRLTLKALIRQQINQTTIPIDRLYKALKKGKRKSASGKIYYESRANRSDVRRNWRL